jgi:hypothetical protein
LPGTKHLAGLGNRLDACQIICELFALSFEGNRNHPGLTLAMAIHTVFVPMVSQETAASVLDAALLVANRTHGHVIGYHIRQQYEYYPPFAFYAMAGDFPLTASEAQSEAKSTFARVMHAVFEERCDKARVHVVPMSEARRCNGATASWIDKPGILPVAFARAARISDLSMLALPQSDHPHLETNLFESLLMESGAPVLLIPHAGLKTIPERPLFAWDGSLEASRAMRAARRLLTENSQATVLTIGHEDPGTPDITEAVGWLTRSGYVAKGMTVDWPKGAVAECILEQAGKLNADLVVMGGYSHSRMHETLLGGVTRYMLKYADRPILMMH